MCGIAGIVSKKNPIETKCLLRLQEALSHRGPDDQGMWINNDQTVGLAHTRLSIIDLTQSGHQPMHTLDSRYTIIFNGEIYNYQKLKKEMEAQGESFFSTSDTEVLLKLWVKKGRGALDRVRGMFSMVIWDEAESKLTLARDPFGIKPLYFSQDTNYLAFASETRALRAAGFGGEIDPKAAGAFLKWGSIPAPMTFHQGIESLMPGEWMEWEQHTGRIARGIYWSYAGQFKSGNRSAVTDQKEAAELVRQTLLDSVKHHLVSDVPVGAFLSGGIDSTAVVSLMRQAGQERITTFSMTFDDHDLDESYYSRLAARTYQTDHYEWRVKKDEFRALKNEFFEDMDQPTIDGLNTWMVARFAREHGCKVVTSGVGGDEFFYSYDGAFNLLPAMMNRLRIFPSVLKKPAAGILGLPFISKIHPQKTAKIRSFLEYTATLEQGYLIYRQLFSKREILEMFDDKDFAKEAASVDMTAFLPQSCDDTNKQQNVSILETSRYLGSQLLPDSDKFSMAHALELRVPLVDRVVAENLSRIDSVLFYDRRNTPKALLVETVDDIPDDIVYRKNRGLQCLWGNGSKTIHGNR
ncbi:MAG: asparagine synthase (glutamine-hydrolyzing) [Candidatus Marinimicrobia bacterium]|nr:asparagine synthase (glutamine-hydrolyzing) [Candidatus Neomarinimicrobiota bacterium]